MSVRYLGKDASDPVLTTSPTTSYAAGAPTSTDSSNGSFPAYCIEPERPYALTVKGVKTYAVGGFSGAQSTLLQGLYSSSFSSVRPSP